MLHQILLKWVGIVLGAQGAIFLKNKEAVNCIFLYYKLHAIK
jgi:hypothetical protein